MAWTQITYSCGHEDRVQMYGPGRDRERKAEWMGGRLCPTCYATQRDAAHAEQSAAATQAAQATGLPALQGSPKQIAWAETIRQTLLTDLDSTVEKIAEGLAEHGESVVVKARDAQEAGKFGRLRALREMRYAEGLEVARRFVAAVRSRVDSRWFIDNRDRNAETLIRAEILSAAGIA